MHRQHTNQRATKSQFAFRLARLLYLYTPQGLPGRWRIARFLAKAAPRITLPERAVVRSREGFRIAVDTKDFLQREIYLYHEWEPHVCEAMRRFLRSGDVFVDVGENIGYLTLYAAMLVGPHGRVVAFEPDPYCFDRLTTNLNLNGFKNVTLFSSGLGDKRGRVRFYRGSDANLGAGSIRMGPGSTESIEIALEPLDEVLQREPIDRVTMVKLDIEGAEVLALKGMQDLLSRPDAPSVVCEISEWSLAQLGYSKEAIFSIMSRCGYEAEVISPVRRSIYSSESIYFQFDALFTKRLTTRDQSARAS